MTGRSVLSAVRTREEGQIGERSTRLVASTVIWWVALESKIREEEGIPEAADIADEEPDCIARCIACMCSVS